MEDIQILILTNDWTEEAQVIKALKEVLHMSTGEALLHLARVRFKGESEIRREHREHIEHYQFELHCRGVECDIQEEETVDE